MKPPATWIADRSPHQEALERLYAKHQYRHCPPFKHDFIGGFDSVMDKGHIIERGTRHKICSPWAGYMLICMRPSLRKEIGIRTRYWARGIGYK